jgi:endonuclease/exonuclease/phosphatase family metal-dependent hydrolase
MQGMREMSNAKEGTSTVALIKFASYNIHLGIGRDGMFAPHRVAAVIGELEADVIALQEVEFGAGDFDMFSYLSTYTGYAAVPGPTMPRPGGGEYGNGLLSRHPVLDVRRIELSVQGREPRGALDVDIDCDGRPVRVVVTHLGLRPSERRLQITRLLRYLDRDDHVPMILLGDLNEWFLWGRPLRWLPRHFQRTPAPATFPSGRPVFALDRVWVWPRELLQRVSVHSTPLSRVASDHLPLTAIVSA